MPYSAMPRPAQRLLGATVVLALGAAGLSLVAASPAAATTTWTSPEALHTPSGGEGSTDPTISADGRAVAFGIRGSGSSYVQANVVQRPATVWTGPTALSGTSNGAWADPTTISENGEAVVWDFSDNAGDSGATAQGNKLVTGAWQSAASPTSFNTGAYVEQARVDDSGSQVAWASSNKLYVADWDSAGNPGTPTVVSDESEWAGNAEFAGNGTTILYNQGADSSYHAFVARKSGSTWTRTDVSGGIHSEDIFGISENGNKVVFRDYDTEHAMATAFNGTSWSTPVDISGKPVEDYDQYYFVTADGSFIFKDDDEGHGWISVFRDGGWLAPEQVGDDVDSVRGSSDASTIVLIANNQVITRTLNGSTWEPAVSHSEDGEFPGSAEISQEGCAITWKLSTGDIYFSQSMQACSPKSVAAAAATKSSAKVSWPEAPEGTSPTTSYEVETFEAGTKVAETCTLSTPFPDPLTCNIDGLSTAKSYTFRVRAVNTEGNGPWSRDSNPVTLTDDVVPVPPVSHALTLAAGKVTGKKPNSKVNLKGTTKKSKVKVYIYRANKPGGFAKLVATTTSKAHKFAKNKVSLGGRQTAFFCAREKSKFSNLVKVTTPSSKAATRAARGDMVRCPR